MGKTVKCLKKSWKSDPKYADWIKEDESNYNNACCKICHSTISLSNMGRTALDSHAQGAKHRKTIAEIQIASKQPRLNFRQLEPSASNVAQLENGPTDISDTVPIETSNITNLNLTVRQVASTSTVVISCKIRANLGHGNGF